jgi:hypothetical protein
VTIAFRLLFHCSFYINCIPIVPVSCNFMRIWYSLVFVWAKRSRNTILVVQYTYVFFQSEQQIFSANNNQLQGAEVYACDTPVCSVDSGELLFTVQEIINSTHSVHFLPEPVTAQSFMISLVGNILTICEFVIYTEGNNITYKYHH